MAKDEVLIVGAGPVGLTMGIQLARFGIPFRIIDKSAIQAKDSRAAGIQPRTLEVLEDIGILPSFLKEGVKVTGFNIYSKKQRLVHAVYEGLDTPYSFIIDIPQSQTEHILLHELERLGATVQRETELNNLENKGTHVEVMLQRGEGGFVPDEYAYVIGCDGARSACRKLTNTPFPGSEYPIQWIVLDAKIDWEYDSQEMNLFPHEEGLTAIFPLPHDRVRITIERKEDSPPTFDLAVKRLRERISPDINLHEPADLSAFIIHHRQAAAYRTRRVFLAGDAAHLHSPAGGQGMNTGMQDAYNLSWKLALVMQGKAQEEILETYHEERHPIAKAVLSLTDKVTRVMTVKSPALSFMRDAMMTLAGSFSPITDQLPKRFSQIYLHYKPNAIVVDNDPSTKMKAGQRAPDHILKQGGKEVRLFDLFKGTHHTLLIFSGKKPGPKLSFSINHPEIKTYFLYRNESDCTQENNHLLDREPSAHTHYGITKPTVVLIRPDGYIGYIQESLDKKGFKSYLKKVFTS